MKKVHVIDSHTGGEPTRVVIAGGPELGAGPLSQRRERFRQDCDSFRSAVVNEPRGSDVLVGAMLVEPHEANCVVGVIFFNNVGVLQMCGHGTIGLAITLAHMGRISPGTYRLDTPVGIVGFEYHGDNRVTLRNVPSYRHAAGVKVIVPSVGPIIGDIAWGGNWFFLAAAPDAALVGVENIDRLTRYARDIQTALRAANITGADGADIDHIELIGAPRDLQNHARNFVLCPGGAYDRSPCGTGTSAKIVCLAADGKLQAGQVWRQESVIGSIFEASYEVVEGKVIPSITGTAYVTAEATLLFDPSDPFRDGVRP